MSHAKSFPCLRIRTPNHTLPIHFCSTEYSSFGPLLPLSMGQYISLIKWQPSLHFYSSSKLGVTFTLKNVSILQKTFRRFICHSATFFPSINNGPRLWMEPGREQRKGIERENIRKEAESKCTYIDTVSNLVFWSHLVNKLEPWHFV